MKSLVIICSVLLQIGAYAQPQKEYIYVGTYSIRDSKGIYVFELNRASGSLKLIQTISGPESPTYIEVHPSGKFLYSVNRGAVNKGDNYGSASAYAINRGTGKLTLINHVSAFGKDPCHISIDRKGEWAFISNYGEGNLVVLPILQDGSLGAPSDSKKYYGKSVNKFRQEQPHIHSAEISTDNKYLYVSDLGTDKIYTYALDAVNGRLTLINNGETTVSPGSGPRHFAIHPLNGHAYSAEELSSTVAVFQVDKTTGVLSMIQDTVRSLPPDTKEVNTSADIHIDAKGKFLYLSNRGYDGISIYSIEKDGGIKLSGNMKTKGKTPRNFLVDKKGKYIWVANQNSDNITIFRINPKTGMLAYTNQQVRVPSPVCIKQLSN
jgi:6-phosphogluconolactonase